MSRKAVEVELLRDLIAIPSVSGGEAAIAEWVEETARRWGMDVVRDKTVSGSKSAAGEWARPSRMPATSMWCRQAPAGPGTRSIRCWKAIESLAGAPATPRRQ